MTSVADGRTHTIATADFERGLSEATGRYRAVCGADVVAASLAARLGATCPRCAEHRGTFEEAVTPPGLPARLLRHLRPGGRS